jgi:hypothetical protein
MPQFCVVADRYAYVLKQGPCPARPLGTPVLFFSPSAAKLNRKNLLSNHEGRALLVDSQGDLAVTRRTKFGIAVRMKNVRSDRVAKPRRNESVGRPVIASSKATESDN